MGQLSPSVAPTDWLVALGSLNLLFVISTGKSLLLNQRQRKSFLLRKALLSGFLTSYPPRSWLSQSLLSLGNARLAMWPPEATRLLWQRPLWRNLSQDPLSPHLDKASTLDSVLSLLNPVLARILLSQLSKISLPLEYDQISYPLLLSLWTTFKKNTVRSL